MAESKRYHYSYIKNKMANLQNDARNLCSEGKWKEALSLYREGLKMQPYNMTCRIGEQRASYAIKNILEGKLENTAPKKPAVKPEVKKSVTELNDNDCTDKPQFKELCKDFTFIKKTMKSEYFPKDESVDDMLCNLKNIMPKYKPADKNIFQPLDKEGKLGITNDSSDWTEALDILVSLNDPNELLRSAIFKLAVLMNSFLDLEMKNEMEGELRYLIMKAHVDLGNYEEAHDQAIQIMKMFYKLNNLEVVRKTMYLEGRTCALKGNYTAAIKVWQDLLKKTTNPDQMAQLLHEVGRCFFKLGQLESAQEYGKLSLEAAKEGNNDTFVKIASIFLAQLQVAKGNKTEAIEFFNVAEGAARRLNEHETVINVICEARKLGSTPRRPDIFLTK